MKDTPTIPDTPAACQPASEEQTVRTQDYNPTVEFQLDGKLLDPRSLCVEDMAILEVIKEECLKLGPGNPDGKQIFIGAAKVLAKLKELQQQQAN